MARPNLDTIPAELALHILSFLAPGEVAGLLGVSRRMRTLARDARLWRDLCFDRSRRASMLEKKYQRRRAAAAARAAVPVPAKTAPHRVEIRAAWNTVWDDEPVSWYDEYVQRHAPIAVSWFELPRRGDVRLPDNADVVAVCGVALYRPRRAAAAPVHGGDDSGGTLRGAPTVLAVAPLEDGAVCLWDVNGTVARRGAIVRKSAPGLLFGGSQDGGGPAASVELSVTESVSVDSEQHVAYFAIQNRLVEVDLATLSVVRVETFSHAITALSAAHPSVPLTVGTGAGIGLHDARQRRPAGHAAFRSVDAIAYDALHAPDALFPPPGPLSILHAQQAGSEEDVSHDIYAAGRIPSILHYDRRQLAAVKDAIHSGASLCGLASIPYPFPSIEGYEDRAARAGPASGAGRTVVACGEYKTKGSLELYPADPGQRGAPMVNRQTSSFAKIFSVALHGKRIVLSDGAGLVKWFERDGFTEARQCRLGSDDYRDGGADGSAPDPAPATAAGGAESGDIARRLLPVQVGGTSDSRDFVNNDLLFWTGEKLGVLRFSPRPGFRAADFEQDMKTEDERAAELEGDAYRAKMRQLFKAVRYYGGDSDSDE